MGTAGSLLARILARGVGTFACRQRCIPCPVRVAPCAALDSALSPSPAGLLSPACLGQRWDLTAVCLVVLAAHTTLSILLGEQVCMPSPTPPRVRGWVPELPSLLPILRDEPEVTEGSFQGKELQCRLKRCWQGTLRGCAEFSGSPGRWGRPPAHPRDGVWRGRSGRAGAGRGRSDAGPIKARCHRGPRARRRDAGGGGCVAVAVLALGDGAQRAPAPPVLPR